MKKLYTYAENDSTGWIGGFNENAMVAGYEKNSIDEDEYEEETEYDDDEIGNKTGHKYNIFMDYQGNSLFDSINYVSGKETEL